MLGNGLAREGCMRLPASHGSAPGCLVLSLLPLGAMASQLVPLPLLPQPWCHPPNLSCRTEILMPTLGPGQAAGSQPKAWEVVSAAPSYCQACPETAQPCLMQRHDGGRQPRPYRLGSETAGGRRNWVTGRQGCLAASLPE